MFEYGLSLLCVIVGEDGLPNNVTTVAQNGFEECFCITSVIIPESIISIEDSTFMNITYVDQFGGYVADFGTYMEAYSLRSELEVQDIVKYIESTKSRIAFTRGAHCEISLICTIRGLSEGLPLASNILLTASSE